MIVLNKTCGACPEQYDAYLDKVKIGYLRLRHGYFRAEYLGKIVYESSPRGDGSFEEDERVRELNNACRAILNAHMDQPVQSESPIYEMTSSCDETDS